MREGLELVLDKIESRIGKRGDFLVEDVMNYFLQDEGVIEMPLNELEHYAIMGDRIEKTGIFEYGSSYQPGGKFLGKYNIYDKSVLLSKEFLARKYGVKYETECCKIREKFKYLEWVEAGGIVIATLDYIHILCIEISLEIPCEELYIVEAFRAMHRLDPIECPDKNSQEEERQWLLGYMWGCYENEALKMFKK